MKIEDDDAAEDSLNCYLRDETYSQVPNARLELYAEITQYSKLIEKTSQKSQSTKTTGLIFHTLTSWL